MERSVEIVRVEPCFAAEEQHALAGVLSGYRGLTREAYALDLRQFVSGTLLVAAGLSSARDHALISLLALNGPRISEALGADIEALGLERGHRTRTVTRTGGTIKRAQPAGCSGRVGLGRR